MFDEDSTSQRLRFDVAKACPLHPVRFLVISTFVDEGNLWKSIRFVFRPLAPFDDPTWDAGRLRGSCWQSHGFERRRTVVGDFLDGQREEHFVWDKSWLVFWSILFNDVELVFACKSITKTRACSTIKKTQHYNYFSDGDHWIFNTTLTVHKERINGLEKYIRYFTFVEDQVELVAWSLDRTITTAVKADCRMAHYSGRLSCISFGAPKASRFVHFFERSENSFIQVLFGLTKDELVYPKRGCRVLIFLWRCHGHVTKSSLWRHKRHFYEG